MRYSQNHPTACQSPQRDFVRYFSLQFALQDNGQRGFLANPHLGQQQLKALFIEDERHMRYLRSQLTPWNPLAQIPLPT
jgi:hypothetical protein